MPSVRINFRSKFFSAKHFWPKNFRPKKISAEKSFGRKFFRPQMSLSVSPKLEARGGPGGGGPWSRLVCAGCDCCAHHRGGGQQHRLELLCGVDGRRRARLCPKPAGQGQRGGGDQAVCRGSSSVVQNLWGEVDLSRHSTNARARNYARAREGCSGPCGCRRNKP